MDKTKIDWCDMSWNPVTGCLHGCEYCYARGIANRFGLPIAPQLGDPGMEGACKYDSPDGINTMLELAKPYIKDGRVQPYPMAFLPTFHKYRLGDPALKQRPRNIFVGSMTDLFGDWVPDEWISQVFRACRKAPQHNYMFLTKNPKRYEEYGVPEETNNWYGTTVTGGRDAERIAYLPALRNTFLSVEPLLDGTLPFAKGIKIQNVDWVIIGAETGKRPDKVIPKLAWVEELVEVCRAFDIPVFMKSNLAEVWGEDLLREYPSEVGRVKK